jgi:glycosyltransferase involved in cell wall biosynthesis
MRIAQIAPLSEAVPPKLYGGTERVVSWLTEELVAKGHEVTLFAAGGSQTSAHLVPCSPRGLRLAGIRDHLASHLVMLNEVYERVNEFDVVHFHIDLIQYVLFKDLAHKCVTTLHGRLDLPDFAPIYRSFPNMPLISISRSQRAPMPPNVFWLDNVPHGLPASVCPYNAGGGDYLAFLGRITRDKRPDRAIEIAKRAGVPLKMAAKIDKADEDYFREVVSPLLDHPLIKFVGEISEQQKTAFLRNALALLFPIDWPEPFGLVMIEAMSAGTPVIAWRKGSVPEVIDNGVSGLIVDSLEEAVAAVRRVQHMNRAVVRKQFEARFTAHRMAEGYVEAYRQLLARPASRLRRFAGLGVADRGERAIRFPSEAETRQRPLSS